ncbi:hypothetical protein D0864_08542 [Hortaea werneckii]|uniref:DUF7626 domain-containing protein n=1 Tax=Hortaea werneckii TaxID=91943 RepID=A0A3M7EW48_HORWE|nr:hypothetical protein KC317_g5410 [Hortaea werneckii]KAI7614567.1 hypothetical protein KC346_g6879 [Hortaea werneckii]KAI7708378.1 hypothetical protein KC322_g5104 [Hortaea werneckii]RMY80752.1 hypothetical protein D0864_08542 [Hortaea werneckii]
MSRFAGSMFFGGTELVETTLHCDNTVDNSTPLHPQLEESEADQDSFIGTPQADNISRRRSPTPSAAGHKGPKRVRVQGGKAAVPKRIVADYDSDDGRIITLKQQGYSDEYVAQKLTDEGRVRYVPKTVGSRWLRLRKALQEVEDDKLDDELSDWHVGEDDELESVEKVVDEKYKLEVQKVYERKWREIAAVLAEKLRKKKYTAKACKERFEAVKAGTALKAIELDSDQEGRKLLREERIAANKARRAEQAAEAQRLEDEKQRKHDARQAEQHEKEKEREQKIKERQSVKKMEAEMKEARKMEKERSRLAKQAKIAQAKAEEEWQKQRRKAEAELYRALTGKRMQPLPLSAPTAGSRKSKRTAKKSAMYQDEDDTEEDDFGGSSNDEEYGDGEESEDEVSTEEENDAETSAAAKVTQPTKPVAPIVKATVTKETLFNARSIMSDAELNALLFERGMPRRGLDESHPEVVARLAEADEAATTVELTKLLSKYFDKGKGSKKAKVRRLQEHNAYNSEAGLDGVRSTDPDFQKSYHGGIGGGKDLMEGVLA